MSRCIIIAVSPLPSNKQGRQVYHYNNNKASLRKKKEKEKKKYGKEGWHHAKDILRRVDGREYQEKCMDNGKRLLWFDPVGS